MSGTTHVGLDVDARWIHVAMLLPRRREPVEWKVANEGRATARLARRLLREAPGDVRACYEAGPTGYVLQRRLQEVGVLCEVVAPSLILVKPGERVKTDRRDARKLAELLRAGVLTEVHPPSACEEAARDLCRAREDAVQDLMRCRHRLGKWLLRHGLRWQAGRRAWTGPHRDWLRSLSFDDATEQACFDHHLSAAEQAREQLRALDVQLEELASRRPWAEPVGWLRCFRGIDTVTALTVVTELHGFARFHSPRQLMSHLGLTPSEDSSGGRTRRGGITKAGNAHVRRVLVEAAWHYRHRPAVGPGMRRRREGQPSWAVRLADQAQQRLHQRMRRLLGRGKQRNEVAVAVARELVGFIWAAMRHAQSRAA